MIILNKMKLNDDRKGFFLSLKEEEEKLLVYEYKDLFCCI